MPVIQMLLLGLIVLSVAVILYFVPLGLWIQGDSIIGIRKNWDC